MDTHTTALDHLNDPQREAVSHPPGNILVLAGAGSGKTRVLVQRIAWLIQQENVSPFGIMAVTFTNKAAREMRVRLEEILGGSVGGMWVGTFHGLAHRMLRAHWHEAQLPESFQILDSDDQYRMIRRVMRALEIDEAQYPPKQAQWYVNGKKDEGIRSKHMEPGDNPFDQTMFKIYSAYEEACQTAGLIDFAEILLRSLELLRDNSHLLEHYQQRFSQILVDEFQDTNTIQYAWLRLLTHPQNHIMVVGDDDQSIYGWRGAKVENIQRFNKDFPGVKTIRLEQNYRSTGVILSAANALIEFNGGRLGKKLWTDTHEGELISLYGAFNEADEAKFIVEKIVDWKAKGGRYSEAAVLYRSNAQSRVLEEYLLQGGIPYRVYGGQRFFERAEIKDATAYLRLLSSRDDDAAFERVINTPVRGLGDRTVSFIREHAREGRTSLWQATKNILSANLLPARAHGALENFLVLIDSLGDAVEMMKLHELTEHVIRETKLPDHYLKEGRAKAQTRTENLEELISATKQFFNDTEEENDRTILRDFLAGAALEAGDDQAEMHEDSVQLMTMHSAKGLEFPLVFLAGVEEGLFPHRMSMADPVRLEEERRLCYVGITRAMKKLYICYAEKRSMHGTDYMHQPSRFISEIPNELVEHIRVKAKYARPITKSNTFDSRGEDISDTGLRIGQWVKHQKFGEGVIVNFEGSGSHARVEVKFSRSTKWLVVGYANLTT